ncbi:MAG TPA: hypothetical protein VH157_03765 [Bryobacteraceae bacterium]|nr:hypothetical protein [Bryobacteraceae bacterium]
MAKTTIKSVDVYIASQPEALQGHPREPTNQDPQGCAGAPKK